MRSLAIARVPLLAGKRGALPQNQRPCARHRPIYRTADDRSTAGELARDARLAAIEALLFMADEPLTARRLAVLAGLEDTAEATQLVARLQSLYERGASAFQVEELAGGYQLYTLPEFHPWLARVRRTGSELKLSAAARETLAIVAYRQPIMRAEIEAIRGVQCGEILRHLMEKGLVRIAGRDESLGRPVLYATSRRFLQVYGLRSLRDLPRANQLRFAARKDSADEQATDDSQSR